MLRELLAIFRSENPLSAMGEQFAKMLKLTLEMTNRAGTVSSRTRQPRRPDPHLRTGCTRQPVGALHPQECGCALDSAREHSGTSLTVCC